MRASVLLSVLRSSTKWNIVVMHLTNSALRCVMNWTVIYPILHVMVSFWCSMLMLRCSSKRHVMMVDDLFSNASWSAMLNSIYWLDSVETLLNDSMRSAMEAVLNYWDSLLLLSMVHVHDLYLGR